MKKYKIEVDCSVCGIKQTVKIVIGQPQTIACLSCGSTYNMEATEVKPKNDDTFCYYCKDDLATEIRNIPIHRRNGYKLMNFEAHLCDGCNCLSGDFLSKYFSI